MPHGIIPQWNLTQAITFATVAGIAMLLNTAEIIFLIKKHNSLKPQEQLLLSLSISDFLVGLTSLIGWITVITVGVTYFSEAIIFLFAGFSFVMSLSNLIVICVERYTAVRYPFKHMIWTNKNRMKRIIILIWIKMVIIASPLFVMQLTTDEVSTYLTDTAKLVASIIIVTTGIVFIAVYVYVIKYFKARRFTPWLERQRDKISQKEYKYCNQKREINLLVTSILIIMSYIICLYP